MNIRRLVITAFFPSYWLAWMLAVMVSGVATLISLEPNGDPHSLDPEVVNAQGNHATGLTVILALLTAVVCVGGLIRCLHKARTATHPLQDSLVGGVLGLGAPAPAEDQTTKSWAERHPNSYSLRDPREQTIPRPEFIRRPVRDVEEHEGYVIHDRRTDLDD